MPRWTARRSASMGYSKSLGSSHFLDGRGTAEWCAASDRSTDGQRDRKSRAHSKGTVYPDAPAVCLDDLPGYGQPQPRALCGCVGLIACLEEFLEDVRQLLGGYSDAGIAHGNAHVVVGALDAELDRASAVRELERVREKVAQHFVDTILVPEYMRRKISAANDAEVDLPL